MQIHTLIQGTPEWHAHRARHFNASDAAAMLGLSPHKSRTELLHELHVGLAAEVSSYAEAFVLRPGHEFEAKARPLAEDIYGEDLYPVTGTLEKLSASFDGLTLDERRPWEHKRLNDELRAAFADMATIHPDRREMAAGRCLPIHHRVQLEQQLIISGAESVLFMATDWDGDTLLEEHHCRYYSEPALAGKIIWGWAQFEKDLAAYVPPEAAAPAPVGQAPDTLPALRIELQGAVMASNLDAFRETALAALRGVNRELTTDQHFADAEKTVKWCGEVESRLAAAKQHALSQTTTIDSLFKTIDDISAEARTVRLALEKDVKRRKEEIKEGIIAAARAAWADHLFALDGEIAPLHLALPVPPFAEAAKNKRTLATLHDAIDTELARAKIAADAMAREVRAKLTWYGEEAAGHLFLFADLQDLIAKPVDDFRRAVSVRLADHRAAEAKRAEQEAVAKLMTAELLMNAAAPKTQPVPTAPPAPWVDDVPLIPTLKLGAICERLGFVMNAAFVAEVLKVQATPGERGAKLYTEQQFTEICAALVSHVSAMDELYAGA